MAGSMRSKIALYINHCCILLNIILLHGCNFVPIYSDKYIETNENNPLRSIEVQPITSIEGAEFCHLLSQLLPLSSKPKYLLKVQFDNDTLFTVIQKNSNISRQALYQIVKYQLIDIETKKILVSGTVRHMLSYNMLSSAFANYIETNSAVQNLTKHAAEEVRTRLMLYLNKTQKTQQF
jgi:hypothetical protein